MLRGWLPQSAIKEGRRSRSTDYNATARVAGGNFVISGPIYHGRLHGALVRSAWRRARPRAQRADRVPGHVADPAELNY
jgi:hypothetical protein